MRLSSNLFGLSFLSALSVLGANIVTEFPTVHANPNVDWSYGSKLSHTGGLTLFGAGAFFDDANGHGYNAGSDLAVYRPEVDAQIGTVYLDDDFLNFHPNPSGSIPVVRWTAPATGNYDISFVFKAHDTSPSGVELRVVIDNAVEWSDSFA